MSRSIESKQIKTKKLMAALERKIATFERFKVSDEMVKHVNEQRVRAEVKCYKKIRKLWWNEYMALQPEIDQIATELGYLVDGHSAYMGACHNIWRVEQEVMKEKYGIYWPIETDVNPYVMYD